MTGVEILATEEVAIDFVFNWTAFWIAAGVIFTLCCVVGIFISIADYDCTGLVACIIVGAIFSCLIGYLAGACEAKPTKYETHYKVTISDEVSMSEFTEKYEIVDQEGKIYTIRERD